MGEGSSQRASCICFQGKRDAHVSVCVSGWVLSRQTQGCGDPEQRWAAVGSCHWRSQSHLLETDHLSLYSSPS